MAFTPSYNGLSIKEINEEGIIFEIRGTGTAKIDGDHTRHFNETKEITVTHEKAQELIEEIEAKI